MRAILRQQVFLGGVILRGITASAHLVAVCRMGSGSAVLEGYSELWGVLTGFDARDALSDEGVAAKETESTEAASGVFAGRL